MFVQYRGMNTYENEIQKAPYWRKERGINYTLQLLRGLNGARLHHPVSPWHKKETPKMTNRTPGHLDKASRLDFTVLNS